MRKIILYSATSINHKIARPDGSVDWLDSISHPEGEDYGYAQFFDSIDTTIMGNQTYKEVLGFGVEFPYKEKKNFVLTRDVSLTEDENVTYLSGDVVAKIKDLKTQKGKDIWLVGGGQLNTFFLNHGLIDEVIIHIMPLVIPEGIDLFPNHPAEIQFKTLENQVYSSGVVEIKFKVMNGK